MKPQRIYIAGPYSAASPFDRMMNVNRAMDAGIEIIKKGHIPYIPHLYHYVDNRAQNHGTIFTYDDYMWQDMQWLRLCDALYFVGASEGANKELAWAWENRMKIYASLSDIPEVENETRYAGV